MAGHVGDLKVLLSVPERTIQKLIVFLILMQLIIVPNDSEIYSRLQDMR